MSSRRYGRVTVEGWLEESPPGATWSHCPGLRVTQKHKEGTIWVATLHTATAGVVEYLPEPEDWHEGDWVLGPHGGVYRRTDGNWLCAGSSERIDSDFPQRPLLLLVRDGKPVTP